MPLAGAIDFTVAQIGQTNGRKVFRGSVPMAMENVGTENGFSSLSERQQGDEKEMLYVHCKMHEDTQTLNPSQVIEDALSYQ
jgi:hypothetical protein